MLLTTKLGDFGHSPTSRSIIFMHDLPEIHVFPLSYWICPGYN